MKNLFSIVATGLLLLCFNATAQQKKMPVPKVESASVPFYPPLAPGARIEGIVALRVTTDGKRVSAIDAESGPPMLVRAAKENVNTWQFERHTPTSLEVTFRYRLLSYKCDSQCHCESEEKESILLQLPTYLEVSTTIPMICDPAVPKSK